MINAEAVHRTREQRRTARIKGRFDVFIQDNFPRQHTEQWAHNYLFYVQDKPYELWKCELSPRESTAPRAAEPESTDLQGNAGRAAKIEMWLLWDGGEVLYYDETQSQQAFTDLVNGLKARRLDAKLKYYTSPLTISAVLALILFLLIAALELMKYSVPDQLWSVFTAVVAFYFGREGARRDAEPSVDR